MFDIDRFVADCKAAVSQDKSQKSVREVVARAVSEPGEVLKALGKPSHAGIQSIYRSADFTILNVIWAPLMTLRPHNHCGMWAVIGLYGGREDNIFWRQKGDVVEAAGAAALSVRDAEPLGKDIIHSVTNPIEKYTGAIHVYGGDFFAERPEGRWEWDPETLSQIPYEIDRTLRLFEEANARARAPQAAPPR